MIKDDFDNNITYEFSNGSRITPLPACKAERSSRADDILIIYEVSYDGGQTWEREALTKDLVNTYLNTGYLVRGF